MLDPEEDELVDAIPKNREASEIRREAIDFLRVRTARNVKLGVTWVVLAIGLSVARIWIEALNNGDPDQSSIPFWVLTAISVYQAARCLYPSPRDRLLLLLAEESQARNL